MRFLSQNGKESAEKFSECATIRVLMGSVSVCSR